MQPDLATLVFVAQQTTNSVIITDRLGRIEWVNVGFTRITGYGLEEVRGRKPGDVLQGPGTDRLAVARMAAALRNGEEFAEELLNYGRDGRPYWVAIQCSPVRGAAGEISHFLAIQTDVTARRTHTEALRQSAESLRTIVSAMPLIVFATDSEGRLTLVEGMGLAKIGLRAGDDVGRSIFELTPEHVSLGEVRRALAGETLMANAVIGELIFETRYSPLRAGDGAVLGCLVVAHDVTDQMRATAELVRAKEAAEAATRAKSAFLATMSHEIRTPLNAVIGTADLLLDMSTSDDQRRYAQTIRTSGDMLLAVIDDILDFSKIEAGNMELERRPFDLRATVSEVIELLAPRAAEKKLGLAAAIDIGVPPRLVGDATRIRQILVNLVGNAVKFTDSGEVLTRAFCRQADGGLELELHVSDTGIGIPEDRMGRLFQPFSQVDASTTRRYGGTGLGLAICKRLCELMGGRIDVRSAPGAGSTFRVSIPVAEAPATAPEERPTGPRPASRIAPLRILLAEDNSVNQQVAMRMLERLGYSARLADNGLAVLRAFEDSDYDLVLMDVQMPELDGLEATRRLRATLPAERQPHIIAMTANAMVGDRDACIAAGMDDYISKPVQRESLAAALQHVQPRRRFGQRRDDEETLDHATVERLRADLGPDFHEDMAALIETYRRQLQNDLASMRAANSGDDLERVALLSHRLRGASATLGARRAVQLCRALETGDGSCEGRAALIDALAVEGERAAAALAGLIDGA